MLVRPSEIFAASSSKVCEDLEEGPEEERRNSEKREVERFVKEYLDIADLQKNTLSDAMRKAKEIVEVGRLVWQTRSKRSYCRS